MSLSEFDLIARFFSDCGTRRADVTLGVGDDAALLEVPPGMTLAVTHDTLVAGVHFLPDVDPESLGHKALAVNLSDLAAMGAEPAWVTLSLTLPHADAHWLECFSAGFCALAMAHGVRLVGGDTTSGPLAVSVAAHGLVPRDGALRRAGARPGDLVCVTGTLGDAGLALKGGAAEGDLPYLKQRLDRPTPRVAEGLALRGLASAAIDVSDGLAADLGHILEAGSVGARIELERLPLSPALAAYVERTGDWEPSLSGGDDYELCFTVPPQRRSALEEAFRGEACPATCIGEITGGDGLSMLRPDGLEYPLSRTGYDHFPVAGG